MHKSGIQALKDKVGESIRKTHQNKPQSQFSMEELRYIEKCIDVDWDEVDLHLDNVRYIIDELMDLKLKEDITDAFDELKDGFEKLKECLSG